jgi:hypothetical protein
MDGESRMPPRLKNSNNIPRGVTLIANVFLCLGGMLFAISALILLPGLVINPYENVSGTERLGLLWIASMVFGVPGIVLSVMTIVSSVGLRKMRKWVLSPPHLIYSATWLPCRSSRLKFIGHGSIGSISRGSHSAYPTLTALCDFCH